MRSLLSLLPLLCLSLAAGESPKITVNSAGSVPTTPTALQVWMTVKEKGADPAAVAQGLQAKRAKLEEKLLALGTKKELMSAEPLALVEKNPQEMMARMRSGGRLKKKSSPTEANPEIEFSQQIRADFPLEKKEADAILVEAETLKAKIKGAKLLDEKAADEPDEEPDMNSGQEPQGPFQFVYFAPHNDEAQRKALASAIEKATASAIQAAKAAGKNDVELSSLIVVREDAQQEAQYYYNSYGRYGYNQMRTPPPQEGMHSTTPKMQITVAVTAEFHFK